MNLRYLSQFELRHLCYFVAVTEANNNFSRAAERLHIEQPPLSQRVKALEKVLKVQLFDRTKRPLRLTAAGKAFLDEVQLALTHLDRAIDQAQQASKGEIGRLTIGTDSSIANSVLPDILQAFRGRCPKVHLVLREVTTSQQVQELREHRLDVGFDCLPPPDQQDADLSFLPLVEESLVVALPETHPLAARVQIPLQALANEPFVLPSPEIVPSYAQIISLCEDAGFSPKVAQEATWMITVLSLIAGGVGVALLPSNVQNLQRSGVVYKAIQGANLTRQLAAVWRREDSSTVLREFLKVMQEVTPLQS